MWVLTKIFTVLAIIVDAGVVVFSCRMAYEKFCIWRKRPFKSWLGKDD